MDNLTHSLIGLAAGEAAARLAPTDATGIPAGTRRGLLLCMGVVGGNLPDVDLLWSMQFATGDRLGYLLEHRGYTHTVLACALLAALLYGGALLWLRFRSLTPGSHDRLTLATMALLSVFLHLGTDALNSYGVHPFWPWNNRWFYGDSLFIIEPLFWLATAPLLFVLRRTATRMVLALILCVAAGVVLAVHRFALPWWIIPLLALSLVVLGAALFATHGGAVSVATMLVISAGFIAAHNVAARRLDTIASRQFPEFTTLDMVLSPGPANPICWDVLLVQSGEGDYVVRRGVLSIASPPSASGCPRLQSLNGTAPITPVPVPDSDEMRWLGEFSAARSSLSSLLAQDCSARELMQFVRAPFTASVDGHWVIGDLRFDRESGVGMAELVVDPARAGSCRYHVPWNPPRRDLLDQQASSSSISGLPQIIHMENQK